MFDFGQLPDYYPPGDHPLQKSAPGVPVGWVCPRCRVSNGPQVVTCAGCSSGAVTYGTSANLGR